MLSLLIFRFIILVLYNGWLKLTSNIKRLGVNVGRLAVLLLVSWDWLLQRFNLCSNFDQTKVHVLAETIHTEKSFQNLIDWIKLKSACIYHFWLIWNQTVVHSVPNQSKIVNTSWFRFYSMRFRKKILCLYESNNCTGIAISMKRITRLLASLGNMGLCWRDCWRLSATWGYN